MSYLYNDIQASQYKDKYNTDIVCFFLYYKITSSW